jgi:hypothetical protein
MTGNLIVSEVQGQIEVAERELIEPDGRARRLWEMVKVPPSLWTHSQYPGLGPVWVIAILGRRCLYFNFVEEGWGWGGYSSWGRVESYHWQQDEIYHAVFQTLLAIDAE